MKVKNKNQECKNLKKLNCFKQQKKQSGGKASNLEKQVKLLTSSVQLHMLTCLVFCLPFEVHSSESVGIVK